MSLSIKKCLGSFLLALLVFSGGIYVGMEVQKRNVVKFPPSFDPHLKMSMGDFLKYCRQNSEQIYQDIWINQKTMFQGVNLCENRYELIKPILQDLKEFSVLDVGAAQGYFSFRIASDFPGAHCSMIEHANKSYDHHARLLYQLCLLNNLPNVNYFHKEISVPVLETLSDKVHFDVVLALLVVHQIDDDMEIRKTAIRNLLQLGNHVILEVSNDVAPELRDYVRDQLSTNDEFERFFLGEVPRYYNPTKAYGGKYSNGKGEFYYFKRKNPLPSIHEMPHEVFTNMTSVYPGDFEISSN